MKYPCIVYSRDSGDTQFADNSSFIFKVRYKITYIDRNPDNEIVEKIIALPMCVYDRFYTADGLNHDTFTLYF